MTQKKSFSPYTLISSLGFRTSLLLIFSLILMRLDHRLSSFHQMRQMVFSNVLPLHYIVHSPIEAFNQLVASFSAEKALRKENEELKERQLLLSVRLQRLLTLEAENAKLLALLKSVKQLKTKALTAKLLSVDLSPFSQQVLLNKGKAEGVFVGQPVLDEAGVMGQVIAVSSSSSRVLLMTDKLSAIPVQVTRNGLRAIATGSGDSVYLTLLHLPDTADIKAGDLLVTSGLGGTFPLGYPVGVVSTIRRVPGEHFIEVLVKPVAGINKSHQVLLLWFDEKAARDSSLIREEKS